MQYMNEVFADVYAGIRRGRANTAKAKQIMDSQTTELQRAAQNRKAMQNKNAPPEQRFSKDEREDSAEALKKLIRSIPELSQMEPVYELAGNEFSKVEGKTLLDQVIEEYGKIGLTVTRENFGDVIFTRAKIKADIMHGIGRAKAVAFAAVPDVIRYGKQIDYAENWKNRGYDTFIFAAPVKFGTETIYVCAIVQRDHQNRFYLHETVGSDGSLIVIDRASGQIKTGSAKSDLTSSPNALSENRVPETIPNVKQEFSFEDDVAELDAGYARHMAEDDTPEGLALDDDQIADYHALAKEQIEEEPYFESDLFREMEDDVGINVNSSEEERYEILKDARIAPAKVDYEKLQGIDPEDYNTRKKSSIEKGIKDLAEKIGVVGVDLENSYLDFPFQFSKKNIRISLHHQLEYGGTYLDYVKAMSCFNELVSSAILIETHTEKKTGTVKANPDLKQVYVFVSAFEDGEYIVPVQFEVKTFWANDAGLYLMVALTKIDSKVLEKPAANNGVGDAANLFLESTYSLRSIFENVNPSDGRFLKYVPDGFLNEEQKTAKQNAYIKQKEEYEGFKTSAEAKQEFSFEDDAAELDAGYARYMAEDDAPEGLAPDDDQIADYHALAKENCGRRSRQECCTILFLPLQAMQDVYPV